MGDLRWLDGYSGQTTAELLALEGRYRPDSIVLAFEEAITKKASRIGPDQLTSAERTVLAVEALEREVNNDGYHGLFTNAPEQVPFLVPSLRAIGCDEVADLTLQAIEALGVKDPITERTVTSAAREEDESRDVRLDECDRAYYEMAGDLAEPLLAFIRFNRKEIALP
jgi:hypothetical protein